MFIKKRGKAKAKAAAEGGAKSDEHAAGAGGGGGGAFVMNDDDFDHRLGNYQLMEPIGKGGYGTVYRGLNIERGMTVAVKRVNLQGIPREELDGIEMEIRLLQNLAHPNIVKYLDSIRTDDHLNIILEYVENGSLSSLLVKFGGMFPEQLCSHYITQVLKGLQYLHTQGVVHRDIKGANILSTKEGQVKLADFGVATKLNESRKSDSVVGTPYWMAPEIIEMTGQQSSACDVWSVGCTCLELLTGKPPYFDLQQMPALFRIVQDEHPPLPDGISPALEDFLMQCFSESTEILAYDGHEHRWLSVDQLLSHEQAVVAAKERGESASPLLLASFNEELDCLEYRPLEQKVIVRTGQQRMVDIKHADEKNNNHVALSITEDHVMYVRSGREAEARITWEEEQTEKVFFRRPAQTMLSEDPHAVVRLLGAASNGATPVHQTPLPFLTELGLSSEAQIDAFVELYGYWLGEGALDAAHSIVLPVQDTNYLPDLLDRCGLQSPADYHESSDADSSERPTISIVKSSWSAYFSVTGHQEGSEEKCSTKLLAPWVMALSSHRLQLVLRGLSVASGCEDKKILVDSPAFREQILIAALHAGYSPYARLEHAAGSTRVTADGREVLVGTDCWSVILEEDQQAQPTLHAARDITTRSFEGRTWCVTLPPHHLVVVRTVDAIASGIDAGSRTASRPLIVGQCFQKDPNRRIDAAGLLKHPWLKKSVEMQEVEELKRRMMEEKAGGARPSDASSASSPTQPDARKLESEESEWDEEELDDRAIRARKAGKKAAGPKKSVASKHAGSDAEDDWDLEGEDDVDLEDLSAIPEPRRRPSHRGHAQSSAAFPQDHKRKPARPNADADEELVIKLRAPIDDDEDPFAEFSDEEEAADEDEEEVVEKTTMKTIRPTPQITPAALQQKPGHTVVATPSSSMPTGGGSGSNASTLSSSFLLSGAATSSATGPKQLDSFVENDEDELGEYTELEADFELKAPVAAQQHAQKLNNFVDAPDEDADEEEADPFDDITFEDGDNSAEDVLLNRAFLRVLDQLSPQSEERVVLDACEKLHEMGTKNPEQIRSLMTNHGVIPIMEMLEVPNPHILHAVLKVVNQIVGKNIKFQQNMSLVGLIPAIIRFGGPSYPTEIRMESASFVRQFCYATDWTRKMFIACDGLPVLVSFLLEDYQHSKTLVWNAIDCIRHVFDINTSPKNDFCRLFCKFGLLEPLSKTLIAIQSDTESADAPDYVLKIAKILHLFSQGDKVVKLHFAKPAVVESMLRVLPALPQDILILLLKSIRNISMDSTTLDLLESAGAIPALIPFLDASQVSENQHQVLLTMYYLCQIKSSRQEQAAMSGIIPHLQRFIRQDHPLKQFAYPIIFLLAKTSWRSRLELKKHGGIQFYCDILVSADLYWRSYALEIIAFWVASSGEDAARVSFVLNTSSNINKLLRVFRETTDEAQFDKLGNSMKKLLSASTSVNQSMGRLKEFIKEIKERLDRHASSNNIRLTLLRILALMVSTHANPVQLIADADGLSEVIHKLYEEKSAVIVSDMAQKILEKLAKCPPPSV